MSTSKTSNASSTTTAELRQTAEDAARLAGKLLSEKFGGQRTIEYKGGIDLVTDADRAAEAAILELLRARHPDHAILAEVSGASGTRMGAQTDGGHRWIIDPLDGTTNYSHRLPHFSVSIAVEDAQGLLAGVVYDPIRDELFAATRGEGAALNGLPIRVSGAATLDKALLCTGFPYDVRENPEAPLGLFNRLVRKARGMRRFGSAALDLAYIACGRYDGYFEFGLKPWDVAAGALLVREAGGLITRIDGAALDLHRGDVIAGGAAIHAALHAETVPVLEAVGWRP